MSNRKYWLMKTEPSVYSVDDLVKEKTTPWEGIRNYQARNFMRDDMKIGDGVLFYHSQQKPPAIVGIAKVCKESYPDFTAWDPKSKYYDPKTKKEDPVWMMVDIELEKKLDKEVSLDDLKKHAELEGLMVIRRGMRLSIQPVEKQHFEFIEDLASS